MRLRKQMHARRDLAGLRTELVALRTEVHSLRSEIRALRPTPPPDGDLVNRYAAWRSGPLVRLGKLLARRAPHDTPPVVWRGTAMRALCEVLLDPSGTGESRHHRLGEAVTALLDGDPGWRNDAAFISALIETRDTAAALAGAAFHWPGAGAPTPIDPARHEILPGSTGDHVAVVVAPGLHTLPALVVAG